MCAAAPVAAQTLTTWSDPVNVTATTGALTKSSGCNGCADSGAHSGPRLTGDGYSEFTAPALTRLYAGLGSDLSAATSSSTIGYAFSLWPTGAWEIRESGVYRKDGTYAAGDRFRVAVESGAVVYRRNGTVVYTSKVAPVFPLVLDVTLYALDASLSQATVVAGTTTSTGTDTTTTSTTTATTTDVTSGTTTAVGPYQAVTNRNVYPKPALPALGPAGTAITDPVFHTPIIRVTDSVTRPGALNRSYRTPSSPHQNAWSVKSSYFYLMGSGGTGPIPYALDPATGTAHRLQPTATGDGGLILKFYIEPQFSYVNDSIIYGSYSGTGGTLHTIDQYDFSTALYTRLVDLETVVGSLSGTYIGGVSSSGGPTERIETFFGGTSQDHHHYVLVFDRSNPQSRHLLDTWASTIDGAPSPITLNFSLHHAMIDRSGRYVMLYTTSADQTSTRKAAQEYLWDVQTGGVTELGPSTLSYGHDAFGYGVYVNKDCCSTSTWDAAQWQFRSLAAPLAPRDLIKTVLSPKEVYLSDHTTWNNARSDRLTPVVSGTYRFGTNTVAWRPWDDEIIAIQTDAPAGTDPTVWRFAQHRTDVSYDGDPTRTAFWYEPHPNVSQDGNWILFTSNWEKTLGTDPNGEAGTGARQDVFLLALKPAALPVSIASASMPAGRVGVQYNAALSATGGSGAYLWSATNALPAGLTLNATTGAIGGVPSVSGAFTVNVAVADAANATNTATAVMTLSIARSAVAIATANLPAGRVTQSYAAGLTASGGSGTYSWTVTAGALPTGVSLDAATGQLSGTLTAAGTFDFSVTATDASDAANKATVALSTFVGSAPISVATASLPGARASLAYAAALQAAGGSGTVSWTLDSGTLPAGLALDPATGALSGTPTTVGSSSFVVRATDATDADNTGTAALSIAVGATPVALTTSSLPGGRERIAYTAGTIQGTGGNGALVWSAAGLPAGLTLNASTGTIAGTPTTAGSYSVTVTATDSSDASNTAAVTYGVVIAAAIKIASPRTLPSATAGTAYAYTVTYVNAVGTTKWNLQGGALPPGMSLNATTGVVSGTSTKKGTYSFNARVQDSNTSDTLTLTITVK